MISAVVYFVLLKPLARVPNAVTAPDRSDAGRRGRGGERGLAEGGIPIGGALFGRGRHGARPRPQPARAGRRPVHARRDGGVPQRRAAGARYRGTTMVTTLSPCWYCSGLIRQFGISRVVIGEARTFYGGHDWLAENGVEVVAARRPGLRADDDRLHRRPTRRSGTRTSARTSCLRATPAARTRRSPSAGRAQGRAGRRRGQWRRRRAGCRAARARTRRPTRPRGSRL